MAECHVPSLSHCDIDLFSRIIVSGIILFEVGIPNLVYGCICYVDMSRTIFRSL